MNTTTTTTPTARIRAAVDAWDAHPEFPTACSAGISSFATSPLLVHIFDAGFPGLLIVHGALTDAVVELHRYGLEEGQTAAVRVEVRGDLDGSPIGAYAATYDKAVVADLIAGHDWTDDMATSNGAELAALAGQRAPLAVAR